MPNPPSRRSKLLSSERSNLITSRPPGLVDVLDRILDKGLVIAGDIKVSLANVELLTLQIRLLVCSIDKAEQIGLNWWRYDSNLTMRAERAEGENAELRNRLAQLEMQVREMTGTSSKKPTTQRRVAAGATKNRGRRKTPE
jgi:gas vesicle protein GvpA/GvpJ/GvpM family